MDDPEAGRMFDRAFRLSGDSLQVHRKFIIENALSKRYEEVVNYYETSLGGKSNSSFVTSWVLYSLGQIGAIEARNKLADELLETIGNRFRNGLKNSAWIYALNDKPEKAIDVLTEEVNKGYLGDISTDMLFESIYDHPRFQELVEKQKKKREEVMALLATYNFPEPEDL